MSKETPQVVAAPAQPPVQELTSEQEILVLRQAHDFFGNFNAVPGFTATKWGQALDAIALVANSLISKAGLIAPAPAVSETSETSAALEGEVVQDSVQVSS